MTLRAGEAQDEAKQIRSSFEDHPKELYPLPPNIVEQQTTAKIVKSVCCIFRILIAISEFTVECQALENLVSLSLLNGQRPCEALVCPIRPLRAI